MVRNSGEGAVGGAKGFGGAGKGASAGIQFCEATIEC